MVLWQSEINDEMEPALRVDPNHLFKITKKVELDELAPQTAAHMVTMHPNYGMLAAQGHLNKNMNPLISDRVFAIVEANQELYDRDFGYDYFGIKTMIKSYLLKVNGRIHASLKWFTHASPTLNTGTQLSSLLAMKDDSIEGIYDTLKLCAQIRKNAGGIGVAIHYIRATGSYISYMLCVFNNTARYVDQGGGKRKASFAM